jgi:hypothetical protein
LQLKKYLQYTYISIVRMEEHVLYFRWSTVYFKRGVYCVKGGVLCGWMDGGDVRSLVEESSGVRRLSAVGMDGGDVRAVVEEICGRMECCVDGWRGERALVEESTVWEGGVLCGWIEG